MRPINTIKFKPRNEVEAEYIKQKRKAIDEFCPHHDRFLTKLEDVELIDRENDRTITQTAYKCICGEIIYK